VAAHLTRSGGDIPPSQSDDEKQNTFVLKSALFEKPFGYPINKCYELRKYRNDIQSFFLLVQPNPSFQKNNFRHHYY